MRRKIALFLMIAVALYMLAWSYYEPRCNAIAGSHAEIRFDGVWCWLDLGEFYTSGKLSELEARRAEPTLDLQHDPRFFQAKPTIESEDS